MGLEKEIWREFIIGNLFKDNEFLNNAFNADDAVMKGKIVHIPNAGTRPTATRNRSAGAGTVIRRTDIDVTYSLNEYSTADNATHIPNIDTVQLSYDKMESVMGEHIDSLSELAAEWMIYDWSQGTVVLTAGATTNSVRTTGAAVLSHLPSATGNRAKFVKEDLQAAQVIMNKRNIPKKDRFALISSDMMLQLQQDSTLLVRDVALELDIREGKINRLYGFTLIERSTVVRYTNAATPVLKDPDVAAAATDNDAVLCWQKNAVERALGTVEVFQNTGDAIYQGDIFSALIMAGGRKRRNSGDGVVMIIQAAAA